MKYNIVNTSIPTDKRKELNEKILYLIDNNLCDRYNITNEDIFNSYTGDGGLHGLEFKNFNSYYAFSEAKKEIENGQFFSPHQLCKFIMNILQPSQSDIMVDMTSGVGNFCNYAPTESNFYLNEIDIKSVKVARHLYPEAKHTSDDIRFYDPKIKFDLVLGNPPYNLDFNGCTSQFYYCQKAYEVLKPTGLMALIMPSSFLSDDFTDQKQIEYMNDHFNFILQFELSKDTFKNVGVENFNTKVMIFQKRSEHLKESKAYFTSDKIFIANTDDSEVLNLHNKYIKPLLIERESIKAKVHFETLQESKGDADFKSKLQKLLYDIKRNPLTLKYVAEAEELISQYNTQKKPEDMDFQEWNEIKLTEERVMKGLKKILNRQNIIEKDVIKLVKTDYNLKLKAYSRKMQQLLDKRTDIKYMPISDIVLRETYPFSDESYKQLVDRKTKEYKRENQFFKDMTIDKDIDEWIKENPLINKDTGEKIYLNDKQRKDINLALIKRNSYLAWETGGGKTVSSIVYGLYKLYHKQVKNIFIVAPAIAIKNTYIDFMTAFNIPYRLISSKDQINEIQEGEFILLTFNGLSKKYGDKRRLYHFLKKKIKQIGNNKIGLIVDEADQISNLQSYRTNGVLSTFRKVKYKLLCSGTNIRNNLSEFKTALDLMYNNSIYMLSENQYIYKENKEKELTETLNEYYNKPIPAYKEGFELYTQSFNPHKATVFGISKYNQDIYNSEYLKKIIDKTLLIRTLKDITGRDPYKINQVPCTFNADEKALYTKVLNEFHEMMEHHIKTGNSRKDSMFRILAQLNTMLKACSIPQTFKEYKGGTPSKFKAVFRLVEILKDERIAIGCTRIKTVRLYVNELKKRYPERKVFSIIGNKVSLERRKEIIKELEATRNGILVSTVQSLSCSMNIGFIDTVLTTENLYNDSGMQQYRARFTRYNSENQTQIYNFFYEKSIEANLMKLILSKEKLCNFMKNETIEEDEILEKFGIDSYIFNSLMVKERDSEGNIRITWGDQEVS